MNNIKKYKNLYNLILSTKLEFKVLFFAIFLGIISSVCSLILPLILKVQIDEIMNGITYKLILLIVLVFIGQLISMTLSTYLLSMVGNKILYNLRDNLWEKLLNAKIDYYTKNQSGEIVSRILTDTTAALNLLSSDLARLSIGIITIIGSISIMLYLDIYLTISLLLSIPVLIFFIAKSSSKLRNVSYLYYEYTSVLAGFLYKILNGIRLVKSYNTQDKELEKGREHCNEILINSRKKAKIESLLFPLINASTMIMIGIVLIYGFYRVELGLISSGDLFAFIFYAFQISAPIMTIGNFISNFQTFSGSTKRIIEILNLETENKAECQINENELSKLNLSSNEYILNIENVSFKYEDNWVLEDISLKILSGTVTAIVGESGSGKSTLFYLLEQFYKPTKGDIKLNSISYKKISLADWRNIFSYVPQDFPIFSGTIRENLLYGINRNVKESELLSICEETNIFEFISSYPDKFNTYLGENGVNISGGQKQRLAIARAFIKNSPFLLLDEPTANLDSISENIIQQSLNKRKANQTVILIAHRISTILNADQIVVLNKGRIEAVGKHNELLKRSKTYQKLFQTQHKDINNFSVNL